MDIMDNGHKEEKLKWCPLIKEWCDKEVLDRCAFASDITLGYKRYKVCGLTAMVLMLSELNTKTNISQKAVKIPQLYRG